MRAWLALSLMMTLTFPLPVYSEAATLIVPGVSIGSARLGMSLNALVAALGPATRQKDGSVAFSKVSIVALIEDGVAMRLSTISPRYRSVHGAGVGMALNDANRLVGDINSSTTQSGADSTALYPLQGIGFVFRGGRAVQVFIVGRLAIGNQPASTFPQRTSPAPPPAAPSPPSRPAGSSPSSPDTWWAIAGPSTSVRTVGGPYTDYDTCNKAVTAHNRVLRGDDWRCVPANQ